MARRKKEKPVKAAPTGPESIAIVYCAQDEEMCKSLLVALEPLVADDLATIDFQRKIAGAPAKTFAGKPNAKIKSATLVILVLSPWLMASDYCFSEELLGALARTTTGDARVVPILVSPVRWMGSAIAAVPVLPDASEPVSTWSDAGAAWTEVADGLRSTIESMRRDRTKGSRKRRRTLVSSAPTPRYTDGEQRRLGEKLEALWALHELAPKHRATKKALDAVIDELRSGPLVPGEIVEEGRFRLIQSVRQTPLEDVWMALDRSNDELVAVNVVHPNTRDSVVSAYFEAMGRCAEIEHPRSPAVLVTQGAHGDFQYSVTAYPGDRTLKDSITDRFITGDAAMQIIADASGVLAAAHEKGIFHGSLSPSTIVVGNDGGGYVIGIGAPDLAGPGALGSLYAPPESLEGDYAPNAAADVYSLGMTALFALRGSALPATVLRNPERVISALEAPDSVKDAIRLTVEWELEARCADAAYFAGELMRDPAVIEKLAATTRHTRPEVSAGHYRRLLDLAPGDSRLMLALAEVTGASGDSTQSASLLAEVLAQPDLNSAAAGEALRRLRHIAESTGEWKALIDSLETRLTDETSADPESLAELARLREEQEGDTEAAAAVWKRVHQVHRTAEQAQTALRSLMRFAEANGDWSEWSDHVAALLPYIDGEERASLSFRVGQLCLNELRDGEKGLLWAEHAISEGLDNDEAPLIIERLRMERGDWEQAIAMMSRRADALGGSEGAAIYAECARLAQVALDDQERAAELVFAQLELDASQADARRFLARHSVRTGHPDRAFEHYEALVKLKKIPKPIAAADRVELAGLYQSKERLKEAATHLDGALKASPSHQGALLALARIREELGEFDAAADAVGRLAQIRSTPNVLAKLGDLAWMSADRDAARAHFDRALAADPNHVRAWWGLARTKLLEMGMDDDTVTIATPARYTPHEGLARLMLGLFDLDDLHSFMIADPLGPAIAEAVGGRALLEQAGAFVDLLERRQVVSPSFLDALKGAFPAWEEAIDSVRELWCGGAFESKFPVRESYRWVRIARVARVESDFDQRHQRRALWLANPLKSNPPLPKAERELPLHDEGRFDALLAKAKGAFQPPQVTMHPETHSYVAKPPQDFVAAIVRNEGSPGQSVLDFQDGKLALLSTKGDTIACTLHRIGSSVYAKRVAEEITVRGTAMTEAQLKDGDVLSLAGEPHRVAVWVKGGDPPYAAAPAASEALDLDDDDDDVEVEEIDDLPSITGDMIDLDEIDLDDDDANTPVLVYASGSMEGTLLPLEDDPYRIGRGRSNELQISDDGKVSRYHCKLVKDGHTFRLVDAGSVNGTLVNDERVDERVLKIDDRLTIGRVKFIFRYATDEELEADDLVDELMPEGF